MLARSTGTSNSLSYLTRHISDLLTLVGSGGHQPHNWYIEGPANIEIEAIAVSTRWSAYDRVLSVFRDFFQKRKNPNSKTHTYPTSPITIRRLDHNKWEKPT
jgi:hypothetical protein